MFDAIQTLIDGSLQSLNYDETITCTIIDNSNKARGEYVVDDGSSTFIAYSDFTSYANNTSVYVTIPQGNYDNRKIILGRRTSQDSEYYNYVAPTESYVDITNNVLSIKHDSGGNEEIFSILANGDLASKGPIYTWQGSFKGYDRIGIKASFKTYLNQFKPISGSYGLYLKVWHQDEITNEEQINNFLFGQNEMYGDVYNFNTFFSQEAVYDISDFGTIKRIDIYLYQLQDFKSKLGNGAEIEDVYIPHEETLIIGGQTSTINLEDNIFVSDLYLSFGYDLKSFTEDKVINYTLQSMEYSSSNTEEERKRKIQCRWVHKTLDGEIISIYDQYGLDKYNGELYWYHYVLNDDIESKYGGKYWQEIDNTRNKFEHNEIVCQTTVQDEHYKAVIITLSNERINYINNLKAKIQTYDIFARDDEDIQKLLIELDKYQLRVPEQINNDYLRWLNNNSEIVSHEAFEAIKEIISNNAMSQDEKRKRIQEIYNYAKQPYDITIVTAILNKMLADNENDKQVKFLNDVIVAWESLPLYDKYEDILTIHNTTMVQANLAVDLIQAITIEVGDKDGRNGVYNIYGEDGQILNRTYSLERHKLILNYNSLLTGMSQFDGNGTEIVTWKIPLTNTMIQTPADGIEYDSSKPNLEGIKDANGNDIPSYKIEGEFIYIRRVIGNVDQNVEIGGFCTKTTEQIFRIKDYYSAVGNNTIYCSVEKGGYTYGNNITLIFGTAGTNGTDYTFRISLSENAEHGQTLLATPQVYDYNNQKIEISQIIKQDWLYKDSKNIISCSSLDNDKQQFNIIPLSNSQPHCFNILKTTIAIKEIKTFLTTYTNIPWSSDINTYNHYEGPDKIFYNSQGIDPVYYKGIFKIYDYLDREQTGLTWEIKINETDNANENLQNFYPSVEIKDGNYSLKVPSMYIKENEMCCLVAKKNGSVVWYQPLLIMQNSFSSALLNSWNGDLFIDEKNGTVMAPMLGAGKKNSDNSFSGVLMGDVTRAEDKRTLTGVYGYDNGIQSYSLTEDGKATFGASGKGQIMIDGNKGTIKSGNYVANNGQQGMKIDLENGEIDSYNFRLNSKYITMNSREDAVNYFTIKGSGTVTQTTYTYNGAILATDNNNQIYGAGITEREVDIQNKTLINVGNSSFYLQTLNYNNNIGQESGLKFDLQKNKLIANEGFTLRAINHMVKVAGTTIQSVQYPEHFVQVHSKYETVNENGQQKNYNHTLLENINTINYKNYYFKLGNSSEYQNDWENVDNFQLYYKSNLKPNTYTSSLSAYYYKKDLENVDLYTTITSDNFEVNKDIYTKKIECHYSKDDITTSFSTLYKKYTTSSLIVIPSVTASEIVNGNTYHYVSNNTLKPTTVPVAGIDKYYTDILNDQNRYYYWQPSNTVTSSVPGIYKSFNYSGNNNYTFIDLPSGYNVSELYTGSGDYMKGVMTIDATANEYPIKLDLGNDTPFKLSWAGLLTTTKLNAIGGSIGRWEISNTDLSADNGKIKLVPYGTIQVTYGDNDSYSGKTTTGTYTCGYISVGNSGITSTTTTTYSAAYVNSLQAASSSSTSDSTTTGVNNIVTTNSEGSFTTSDFGKYYEVPNQSYYYKVISTEPPYYERTHSVNGGIQLLSNGLVSIYKLYIQGGGGTWDGCAKYSQYTIASNHTHTLSATASVNSNQNFYTIFDNMSSTVTTYYDCTNTSADVATTSAVSSKTAQQIFVSKKGNMTATANLSGNSNSYSLKNSLSYDGVGTHEGNFVQLSGYEAAAEATKTWADRSMALEKKIKELSDDLEAATDYQESDTSYYFSGNGTTRYAIKACRSDVSGIILSVTQA